MQDFGVVIRKRPTDYLQQHNQVPLLFDSIGVLHNNIEVLSKYIYETESIYNATGIELDRFGEYVNLTRNGLMDDDYRNEILITRRRLSTSGTPYDVYYNTGVLTNSQDMVITERLYSSFNLHVYDDVEIPFKIDSLVDAASAAGVSVNVTFSRGTTSFFLAGIERYKQILGVNTNYALGVSSSNLLGVTTERGLGLSNLVGMNITPLLLGVGGKVLGADGKAIGLNKYKPIASTDNNVTYLVGTYDN
ncbi:hypothetical protein [Paramixta manurensis]